MFSFSCHILTILGLGNAVQCFTDIWRELRYNDSSFSLFLFRSNLLAFEESTIKETLLLMTYSSQMESVHSRVMPQTRTLGSLSQWFSVYLTNGFHVDVRRLSNRSQITSKCGKNIIDTLGFRLVCHGFVLTPLFRHYQLSVYLSVCGRCLCLFSLCAHAFVCLSGPKVHSVSVRWFVRCWSLVWVKEFSNKEEKADTSNSKALAKRNRK